MSGGVVVGRTSLAFTEEGSGNTKERKEGRVGGWELPRRKIIFPETTIRRLVSSGDGRTGGERGAMGGRGGRERLRAVVIISCCLDGCLSASVAPVTGGASSEHGLLL